VETIDDILKDFSSEQKELIPILHRVQETFGYIAEKAIIGIARHLRLTPNEIYGVLTFYSAFSLSPKGRTVVTVCLGTACHVRGGAQIAEELGRKLSLEPGRTSADGEFTLETVNCLGCCAIGPVVVVNGKYHARVTLPQTDSLLAEYRTGGPKA